MVAIQKGYFYGSHVSMTICSIKGLIRVLFIYFLPGWICFPIAALAGSFPLTLEDIFLSNKYYAYRGMDIHFLHDREAYVMMQADSVNVYSYAGKYQETLMTKAQFVMLPGTDSLGYDEVEVWPGDKLLLISAKEEIYRYSSKADYAVYDPDRALLISLKTAGKIMYPTLSPDGNFVAYVYDNDIYIKDLGTGMLRRVTSDGSGGEVVNGRSDWVYEEEFALLSAMVWTADSKMLCFLRFDESKVQDYLLEKFVGASSPVYESYKYPKAGQEVPELTLWAYFLTDSTQLEIPLPDSVTYVPRIYSFADSGNIDLLVLDRKQQHLRAITCHIDSGSIDTWYEERDSRYVDLPVWAYRDTAGNAFISSEKEGNVILYCKKAGSSSWLPLTASGTDLTGVYGQDLTGAIYFQQSSRNGIEREVAKVIPGSSPEVLFSGGTVEAVFSPGFSVARVIRSGLDQPFRAGLYRTSDHSMVKEVYANPPLQKMIAQQGTPFEFLTIPVNGVKMNAWVLKPEKFSNKKKYPVLFTLYGGPGGQNVTNEWDYSTGMWYRYLRAKGIVVVAIDNRGGACMGTAFKKCTYGQLGELESADQIAAARYFAGMPYVDSSRIAVIGWSYGGFLSLMCMLQDKSPFSTGVAIAPVTHWKLYDAVYAERYMGLISENKSGYERYAPVNLANKLHGNLLLAHGTMDDNVHFQHSMEMARTLNAAGKYYTLLPYPNRDHDLYGGNTRFHLFNSITAFLLQKLLR